LLSITQIEAGNKRKYEPGIKKFGLLQIRLTSS